MKQDDSPNALIRAVQDKDMNKVKKLVAAGADLHARDEHGSTALHYAACGMPEMVRFLLEQGADFHVRDARGFTPLHVAFLRKDAEVVRLLAALGADIHDCIPGMRSPAEEARAAGDGAMLEALGVQAPFVG